jgi:hypothetical protein
MLYKDVVTVVMLYNITPTCSTVVDKLGSMLRVDFDSGSEPIVGVNLVLDLDDSIVRRRGGCYYHDTMRITFCLRVPLSSNNARGADGKAREVALEKV